MMFELSAEVNKNKVFLVKRSELDGRFDSSYYRPEIQRLISELRDKHSKSLKSLKVNVRKGVFDLSPIHYKENGVPFLRISDIKDGTINFENTVYISEEKHLTELYTEYFPGDLVISKVGTIGEVSILPNKYPRYNISQNVIGLRLDEDIRKILLPEFLLICLQSSFGQAQFKRQFTTGVQPKITLEAIREILIPLPDIILQREIIAKMQAAYAKKTERYAESQRLLNSIDEYLLCELGVEFTELEDDSRIEKRIFYRKFRSVTGGRLDPLYHSGSLYQFIDNSLFRLESIGKAVHYLKTGFASGKQDQSFDENGIIQIRPTNISNERELVFNKNIYINPDELSNRSGDILQQGEVLFNNTNSQELVGKTVVFDLNGRYFCSNHITRIRVDDTKVNPYYLMSMFNLYQRKKVFYKICTNWNNQSGINANVLKTVKIPLPPLPKQIQITEKVFDIRNRAKKLQQMANKEFEKAKYELELSILGANI